MRGLEKVSGEWSLAGAAYNLKRMHRLRAAQTDGSSKDGFLRRPGHNRRQFFCKSALRKAGQSLRICLH